MNIKSGLSRLKTQTKMPRLPSVKAVFLPARFVRLASLAIGIRADQSSHVPDCE